MNLNSTSNESLIDHLPAIASVKKRLSYEQIQAKCKQCRICLQPQQPNENKELITPCRCAGSVRYVHEQCLHKWISATMRTKTKSQQQKIIKQGIMCGLCKQLIVFQLRTQYNCYSCQDTHAMIKYKSTYFAILLILIIVAISGSGFAIAMAVQRNEHRKDVGYQIILSICGSIVLFIIVCVGLYLLASQFLFSKTTYIGSIQKRQFISKSARITPILSNYEVSTQN